MLHRCLANKRFQIHCDNRVVVDILRYGRGRDAVLATCARNDWLLTEIFNIFLMWVFHHTTKLPDYGIFVVRFQKFA